MIPALGRTTANAERAHDVAPECRVDGSTDAREWDAFVAAQPDATICHLAGWRSVMEGVLRHTCVPLEARDASGRLTGVLPLVHVRGLAGNYLVSMPFLNDGGPLGSAHARDALVQQAVTLARTLGVGLLELRNRSELGDPLRTSHRKVSVHLALPASVELLWSTTFRAKLRSQIRRPAKEGMTARFGASELDSFYRVLARNMRDLGTPVLPRAFFARMLEVFGERVRFFAVYTPDGTPVAASCCLAWQQEVEVTWASSLREFNPMSPNMLLYATMMEDAIVRGATLFNFGRSSPGAATHRFKAQWGGHDVALPWAFWSPGSKAGTPSADSPAFQLATAAWKRLPLPVANRLGPILARHLP